MNPAQTPYQFAVGFAFSLLAIKSGSILPSAVAHFLNNLAVVCIEYFFPSFIFVGEMAVVVSILGSVVFVFALVLLLMEKGGKNQEKGTDRVYTIYKDGAIIDSLIEDGNVQNDIFTKYYYLGENIGEYEYLTSISFYDSFNDVINKNTIETSLEFPMLGINRGSPPNC